MMQLERTLLRRWAIFAGGLLLATLVLAMMAQMTALEVDSASAWVESLAQVLLVLELACLILAPVSLLVVLVRARPALVLHYLTGPRSLRAVMMTGIQAGLLAAVGVGLCDVGAGLLQGHQPAERTGLGVWRQDIGGWSWRSPDARTPTARFTPQGPRWESASTGELTKAVPNDLANPAHSTAWDPAHPRRSFVPVLERAILTWAITIGAGVVAVDLGVTTLVLGSLLVIPAVGIVVVEGSRHQSSLGWVIAVLTMLGSGCWWRWRMR